MLKNIIIFITLLFFMGCNKIDKKTDTSTNKEIKVYGQTVDNETRCVHYHTQLDIIAIKFKCCRKYYPCYKCHQEAELHKPQVWGATEHNQKAILCGVCKHELTIAEYINSGNKCIKCKANFNPGCSKHYHLYFEK
ncbi:CHY zinc finger protein [Myroides sp. JBRI-B21084]|uniref:CHY zinc finger protein n=1 Tax=Myroides sp. JBRI-B21084 TaxID=3119977 RepID=UPI0026E281CF|nr:CHY zinc finger protein [Paenimyroides cloacae]WKW45636.1 CHY zinc finger protein [Paenimyroides cloacae]